MAYVPVRRSGRRILVEKHFSRQFTTAPSAAVHSLRHVHPGLGSIKGGTYNCCSPGLPALVVSSSWRLYMVRVHDMCYMSNIITLLAVTHASISTAQACATCPAGRQQS